MTRPSNENLHTIGPLKRAVYWQLFDRCCVSSLTDFWWDLCHLKVHIDVNSLVLRYGRGGVSRAPAGSRDH